MKKGSTIIISNKGIQRSYYNHARRGPSNQAGIQCSLCRRGPSDQEASSIAIIVKNASIYQLLLAIVKRGPSRSISRVIQPSYREEGIHLSIAVGEGVCPLIRRNDSEEGIQLSRNIQRS